jgi:hypothetical protein
LCTKKEAKRSSGDGLEGIASFCRTPGCLKRDCNHVQQIHSFVTVFVPYTFRSPIGMLDYSIADIFALRFS